MGRIGQALALVVAGLALAQGALAQSPARVAILPVVIHALEDQAYLRDGIAEMLASRLAQQQGLTVTRVTEAAAATSEADAARAAGRSAGADWVLFGSFTRFGEGASLDLRCIPVTSTGPEGARSVFVQAGNLTDVIPRLDSVVERIAAHVRGGPAAAIAQTPGGAAPASPELQDLRRRVEALEARLPAAQAASPPSGAGTAAN